MYLALFKYNTFVWLWDHYRHNFSNMQILETVIIDAAASFLPSRIYVNNENLAGKVALI